MPVIPTSTSIQQRIIRPEQTIVRDRSGVVLGRAAQQLGQDLGEVADARTQFQASKAQADFLVQQTQLKAGFVEDQDYKTIGSRYQEKVSSSIDAIASNIEDGRARQAFIQSARTRAEQDRVAVENIATEKERDFERGALTERLTSLREVGVTGDMNSSLESARALIASGIDSGYVTNEQGARLFESWRQDTALGKLEFMEPEQRAEALKQDWVQNLPSDQRAKLERTTQAQLRGSRAVEIVNGYLGPDVTESVTPEQIEMLSRKDSGGDTELQSLIRNEYWNRYNDLKRAGAEEQNRVFQQRAFQMDEEGLAYEAIPKDELELLTETQRGQLRNKAAQAQAEKRGAAPVVSDTSVVRQLNQVVDAFDAGDVQAFEDGKVFFSNNYAQLSKAHQKRFQEFFDNGEFSAEGRSSLKDENYINDRVDQIGVDAAVGKQMKADFALRYDSWRKEQVNRSGKEPDDTARQRWFDAAFMELDINGWWPGGLRRAYQVEGLNPQAAMYMVEQFYQENGRNPDKREFGELANQYLANR